MKEIKNIYIEIKEHIKADFKLSTYLFVIIFTFTTLALTYIFNFKEQIITENFGTTKGIIYYILFYILLYFAVLIPVLLLKKKTHILKSTEFWIKTLSFLTVFGYVYGFYKLDNLAITIGQNQFEDYYLAIIFTNLKKILPLIILALFIKNKYDKKDKHFYGFSNKGLKTSPYFMLLLFMLPLIIAASFLPDFTTYYPRFKFWLFPEMFGLKSFMQTIIFELSYAVDFISTEFFFRGVLVIGLASILKKDAVLVMASIYCLSHFGKPVGEAISAFFGGYILGVIALNHKNINGGIIIHI